MKLLNTFHSTTFSLLFIAFFVLNSFVLHNPYLGALLLIAYIIWFGLLFGELFSKNEKGPLKWWVGTMSLLSIIILIGSVTYYVASVPAALFQVMVLLTPLVYTLLYKKMKPARFSLFRHAHNLWAEHKHKITQPVFVISAAAFLLLVLTLETLQSSRILDSVRSPWERIDESVILLFFFAATLVFALLYKGKERALTIPLFIFLLFVFLSVVSIVFPIGYGFDSFIHKATEAHLAEAGTISPKPFYYIGQYVLVLFSHHAFSIPIDFADTFLVPILTAVLLPFAWFSAAAHTTKKPKTATLALVGIFLLPLGSFISTTPQGLANLWILLGILASVPYLLEHKNPPKLLFSLIAIATLLIHPIAGIPLIIYFALFFLDVDKSKSLVRKLSFWSVVIVSSVILPLSFIVNAIISKQDLGVNISNLNPILLFQSLNLDIFFENRFSPLLDLVYLYGENILLIVFLISIWAFYIYRKELSDRFKILIFMVLILGVNYLILSNVIDFSFLIDYERSNFSGRLLPLIAFFLSPLIILGVGHVSVNLRSRPVSLKIITLFLFVTIATSAFYITYPRRDAYETNRGFNVGQADIDAVYLIDNWAEDEPYVVLANQSVSAAAIKEIGFHYYGDMFFYPIPTGDALYQQFLQMNDDPNKTTAKEAVELVPMHGDVNTLFYVVNNYWWQAPEIIEKAKVTANDWRSVGGGVAFIFRYDFDL
jgi:hypothetical protein